MKRLIIPVLLVAGAVMASCGSKVKRIDEENAALVPAPRTYDAYRTNGLILDGKLDDPDWLAAKPSVPFADISVDTLGAKETTVKMLWDDDYFYVGATIIEDKIVANLKQRDTIIWKENDFEVFLDPDNDCQSYFEIEINAIGTIMDLMMNKPYSEGGNFYMPWDCPGLIVETSCDDKAWYAEFAIPRKSVMVGFTKPEDLPFWRVNFSRVEWMRADKEENWVWSPTGKIDMHMPERWGYVYFKDSPVGSVEE